MRLQLTDWQRMVSHQLVGGLRGDLARLRKGAKILTALEQPEDVPEKADPGAMEPRVAVEIGDKEAARLFKELVAGFTGWPLVALDAIEDLFEQLGLGKTEEEEQG